MLPVLITPVSPECNIPSRRRFFYDCIIFDYEFTTNGLLDCHPDTNLDGIFFLFSMIGMLATESRPGMLASISSTCLRVIRGTLTLM